MEAIDAALAKVLVAAIVAGLAFIFSALRRLIDSKATTEQRGHIYAAVKAGINFARSLGLTPENILGEALGAGIAVGSQYLDRLGVRHNLGELERLMRAELAKQAASIPIPGELLELKEAPPALTESKVAEIADRAARAVVDGLNKPLG
ncbi:MAG TPA: hypothetical protein VGE07_00500 [Herpetosiphonaceae bacterium]